MYKKALILKVLKGKRKGQFRFNLVAANGKIVATSGSESYHNLIDAEQTITNNFPSFQKQYTKLNITREQFVK